MTDADERDPLDWGPVYPERIAVGYVPAPEPPPIAPPRSLWQSIHHKIGVRMTLEELKEADAKMTARAEILARLGQPSSASAEVCRELDKLVDQYERDRSRSWSFPLDGNATYHTRIASTLALAAQGLDIGQGERGQASVSGWQDLCDSGMFYVQCYRRRDLWGVPLPDFIPNR